MLIRRSLICFILLSCMKCNARKLNRHLKISSFLNPLINCSKRATFDIGHVEQFYVDSLAEYLNFTYEVVPPRDVLMPGFLLNGTWTGMIGQLQRKEVDIGVSLTDDSYAKYSVVDFTFPVQYVGTAIIIPYPPPGYKTYLLRAPFSGEVWLGVFITAASIIASLWITSFDLKNLSKSNNPCKTNPSLHRWFFVYAGIFSNQDFYLRHKQTSFRLAFCVMLLTSLVLSNVYTGVFTSLIAAPYFKVLANSIDEVAENEHIRVHAYNLSGTTDYLVGAQRGHLKAIGDQLRKNKKQLIDSRKPFEMTNIVRGYNVFLTTDSVAENFVQYAARKQKECRITLAKEKFFVHGQSMNLPKGSDLLPILNQQILRLRQSGLIDFAEKTRSSLRTACILTFNKRNNKTVVTILVEDLAGAFVLLVFGYVISFLVFVSEMFLGYFNRSQ